MNICLKTKAKETRTERVVIDIEQRLPAHIQSAKQLVCDFDVAICDNYYLLTRKISGTLEVICQRCLNVFQHEYSNQHQVAICAKEEIAETLMEHHDCLVASNNQINLVELLTDDLYLFTPEKHADLAECSDEIRSLIQH